MLKWVHGSGVEPREEVGTRIATFMTDVARRLRDGCSGAGPPWSAPVVIYILSLAHGSTICHGSRGDGYVPMPEMGIGVTGIGGLTRTSEPPMDPSQAYKLPTYPQSRGRAVNPTSAQGLSPPRIVNEAANG